MAFEKLTCKNCGSNDFHRDGECYVCNHCGTMHILTDDGTYNIYNFNYEGDFRFDVPDSEVPPVEEEPKEKSAEEASAAKSKKSSAWGCLLTLVIIFFLGSCMFSGDNNKVSDSSSKRDKNITDMALLQKEGHPRLLSTGKAVIDFYAGYGKIVKFGEKSDQETILYIGAYEKDSTSASWLAGLSNTASGAPPSGRIVNNIEIYFNKMKSKPKVTLEEAVKLANSFMPWELIDKHYQLSETVSYRESDKADSDVNYVVTYGLQDKYSYNNYTKQEYSFPSSIGFRICADSAGVVKFARIQIAPRVDRNRYSEQNWQAPGLHQVTVDVSWKTSGWRLLTQEQPPKLLGDYNAMLEFGKKFPVEAVNITCNKEDAISYGLKEIDQLFAVEGRSHNDKSRYVFEVNLSFVKLRPEKQVTLAEAIDVIKRFLPYDLLNKYYKLRFSRKISPTNKNTDGTVTYQVVYDRVLTDATRAEINKLELPKNIRVVLKTDENTYVTSAVANCYTYVPEYKGRNYERVKNEYGEIKEIGSLGRELGPYESGDDFHSVEWWANPF